MQSAAISARRQTVDFDEPSYTVICPVTVYSCQRQDLQVCDFATKPISVKQNGVKPYVSMMLSVNHYGLINFIARF